MASSDVDQKYLSKHAALTANESQLMSSSLYQILGLSLMLARKLVRARRLRRLDTTRDTRSLQLYHHIIWLSREGLSTLQTFVTPNTEQGQFSPELQVLAAKLEASFFHIFCLFHNNPPISQTSIPTAKTSPSSTSTNNGIGKARRSLPTRAAARSVERLRDPIPSYTSDTSYLTNPYASMPPGADTSPPRPVQSPQTAAARHSPAVPPGLAPVRQPPPTSAFIFPPENFLPYTANRFENASRLATDLLPGSHPLRLSVAIEHAAFFWDCAKDGDRSRMLARRAIRDCHASKDPMSDADFEDAAECVGVLGRMMKREGLGSTSTVRSRRSRDILRGSYLASPDSTTRSSPLAQSPRVASAARDRPTDRTERPSSIQASPTLTRSPLSVSVGSAVRSRAVGEARERKSSHSHSTKGSSGSTKSASGGERRSSSERESSALRGTGAMRGTARTRGTATSRAR